MLDLRQTFRNNPLLAIAIAIGGGIAFGHYASGSFNDMMPVAVGVSITSLLLLILSCSCKAEGNRLIPLLVVVCAFFAGAALYAFKHSNKPEPWPEDRNVSVLQVENILKQNPRSWKIVAHIDGRRVVGQLLNDSTTLHVGDSLMIMAHIDVPKASGNPGEFNYAAYLLRQGIEGTFFCYPNEWKLIGHKHGVPPSLLWFAQQRERLITQYADVLDGEELAVISSLTLGDRSLLTHKSRELFAHTGTSHIIALSGFHLSVLIGIFNFLLLGFAKRTRTRLLYSLVLCVLVGAFVLLCGMPVSLVRAALMTMIFQVLLAFQRDISTLNTLSLVALLFFIFSPDSLFDVGFQLSFLSMLAIYVLLPLLPSPTWVVKRKWAKVLYGIFTISLVAQIGTLPLVAYHFHTIPLYALPTAFLIYPFAYLILGGGLLFFILPFAQPFIALFLQTATLWLMKMLSAIALLPYSTIHIAPSALQTALVYIILLLFFLKGKWLRKACVQMALVGVILLLSITMRTTHPLQPQLAVFNNYQNPIHIIADTHYSYVFSPNNISTDYTISLASNHLLSYRNYTSPTLLDIPAKLPALYADSTFLIAGNKTLAYPHFPIRTAGHKPLKVDAMIVSRKFRGDLLTAVQVLQPEVIVIGADLSEAWHDDILRQCKANNLHYHDLRTDGAFIIPLTN